MNLTFINQSSEEEKFYSIMYAPVAQGCEQSPIRLTGYLSNTNLISLQLNHDAEICFILVVSNDTKMLRVEGIYSPGTYICS